MATALHRDDVVRMVAEGAQLVEVLPVGEYDDEHLAGSLNLPLKDLDAAGTSVLDRLRPVIVYCWDGL